LIALIVESIDVTTVNVLQMSTGLLMEGQMWQVKQNQQR